MKTLSLYCLAMRKNILQEFMTYLSEPGVAGRERGGWCRERGMVLAVPREGNVMTPVLEKCNH
jgi:hypothetical protein